MSFLFFLVKDLSSVDSAYRHAATDASIEYERDASTYVKERCISSLSSLTDPDCASKADEAAREGQRKEQDLAAQNITAWWTKIMGVAALIGMALSAVGVWLVKTTFDETRKANDIAKDAMHRQLRAYLTIEAAEIEGPEWGAVHLIIHNSGATPAHEIEIINDRFRLVGMDQTAFSTEQTKVLDIGSQSRRDQVVPWYDMHERWGFGDNLPTEIGGTLIYRLCVPNQNGVLEKIGFPFKIKPTERKPVKT